MINLHLLACISSMVGLGFAVYRIRNVLNPIIIGYGGFSFCLIVSYLHPLAPDPVGLRRTSLVDIGEMTQVLLLAATLVNFFVILLLYRKQRYGETSDFVRIVSIRAEHFLFTAIVLLAFGELVATIIAYGGVAFFSMQQGAGSYGDFRFGMITEFARGGPKFILLIILMRLIYSQGSIKNFVKQNAYSIFCCTAGLSANMAGGLRNLFLLPILMVGFVIIERSGSARLLRNTLIVGILGVVCTLLFVIAGNIRVGTSLKFSGELLIWKTNIPIVDQTLSWVFLYSYPNILNLDQIVYGFDYFQNGKILLSQIFPDALLEKVGLAPYTSSVDFLSYNLLYPYPGLSFRTIYADLFADVGLAGSVIFGGLALAFVVITYTKRNTNAFIMFLFLNTFKGMMLFGMKNSFLGLYDLFPIFLWFIFVRRPLVGIKYPKIKRWGD